MYANAKFDITIVECFIDGRSNAIISFKNVENYLCEFTQYISIQEVFRLGAQIHQANDDVDTEAVILIVKWPKHT